MQQHNDVDEAVAETTVDGSTRDVVIDAVGTDPGVVDELLVEEVSIDGMCGVY
jgi:mycofactocin precursor